MNAMRLALLSDVFRTEAMDDVVRAIAASGFRHVELNACGNWYPHVDFRQPDAERTAVRWRAALEARGIAIPAVAAFTNLAALDEHERVAAVAYCRRALASFSALGAEILTCMVSGSNLLPRRKQERALRRSLGDLAEAAGSTGATIAVEVYPGNFMERTSEVAAFLQTLGAPNVGYLLCVAHLAALGESVVGAYQLVKAQLRHVHLSDTPVGTPEHLHLIPGLGEVGWKELCALLRRDGYRGIVTAQIYSHDSAPAASSAWAFRSLTSALDDEARSASL
jgi:sugar phosphate isomerase/epimerase